MTELSGLILCRVCGLPLGQNAGDGKGALACPNAHTFAFDEGILCYQGRDALTRIPEVAVRDRQAAGYLSHGKFPTQINRVMDFVKSLPPGLRSLPAADLGCGPGPFTGLLLQEGWDTISVDFSRNSLVINRLANLDARPAQLYVEADIRMMLLKPNSFGLLLIADVLQHLGHGTEDFLARVFDCLAPGGGFLLSCFNANIKNVLKGDLDGSFAGGAIPYNRLTPNQVISMMPASVEIENVSPMNIFHGPSLDRIVSRLPGAMALARMILITGRKAR